MLPQSNLITKQLGKKVRDETKGDNCASNQKKETQAEIPSVINPWSSIKAGETSREPKKKKSQSELIGRR